jgi:hypothetical protein
MKTIAVAVIVALAASVGTATAAFVVTSKDIKDGTIQLVDMSANAKRTLKSKRGRRGPRGVQGAIGPLGPQGPQGPQGPRGSTISYTNRYSEHVTVPAGSFRFANAVCPAGTEIVGGGYATDNVSTALLVPTNSYPIGTGDGRGAWYVVMFNIGEEPEAFWAVSYCVEGT